MAASLCFYACVVVNCLLYFRLCGGKFVFYACVALNCEVYLRLRGDKFMPVGGKLVLYAYAAVEL